MDIVSYFCTFLDSYSNSLSKINYLRYWGLCGTFHQDMQWLVPQGRNLGRSLDLADGPHHWRSRSTCSNVCSYSGTTENQRDRGWPLNRCYASHLDFMKLFVLLWEALNSAISYQILQKTIQIYEEGYMSNLVILSFYSDLSIPSSSFNFDNLWKIKVVSTWIRYCFFFALPFPATLVSLGFVVVPRITTPSLCLPCAEFE